MLNILTRLALPLLLLTGCAAQSTTAQVPQTVSETQGVVSAADPRAAAAGVEMLRAGGNAVDAAMATMLALTVVEPQSSGIGGGGFMVFHDANAKAITTYDGRETAPAAATPAYFLDENGDPLPRGEAIPGGKSVGVPGNLRLMQQAHEEHGALPWASLFEPAIRLASEGFEITPRMHNFLASRADRAGMTAWGRSTFFGPDGQPKPVGTLIRNPELAGLLRTLAARGVDYYYTGTPAQNLVRTVTTAAKNPSAMTMGDLASYDAKERPALCGDYRGYRICGMGPPSSGATTVFAILKQLERFDLAALGADNPTAWHLIGESMRLAYADREAYIADPAYAPVPAEGMMNPQYLVSRGGKIFPDSTMESVAPGVPPGATPMPAAADGEVPSTSHFVAVDDEGNVVSYTSTIEGVWGSGLTVDGYFLNNELTDFSFDPTEDGVLVANRVEGGKRPRSSMSPTIVYGPDGEVRLAIGAAGGLTIISQVAKALVGVLDWGLSAQEAIALPQIMGVGDRLLVEEGTKLEAMIPAFKALGHNVSATGFPLKANAVEQTETGWIGAADPRSEGAAVRQ